ncbi:hypothetical protein FOZ63_021707, partial [Perkinsus olseni]
MLSESILPMMDVIECFDHRPSTAPHRPMRQGRALACSTRPANSGEASALTSVAGSLLDRRSPLTATGECRSTSSKSDTMIPCRNGSVGVGSRSSEGSVHISVGNFLARRNSSEVALRSGDEVTILDAGAGWSKVVVAAEEGERAAENSPTYEDLCEKGYLVPSGSGVGRGESMDETVLRRGEGSGDDQTGTPEGVVKIFRQKADFEKGNVPAKVLEESLDAVYAATIGHDVAEALKDDITLESAVEPELVERAWDVVEEMNELTAEEQQLVEQHSEEFDQLVLCGEPPDLTEIDKKERKDGI